MIDLNGRYGQLSLPAVIRTYTTVSTGDFMERGLSRTVNEESVAGSAQTPGQEAGFPLHLSDFFRRISAQLQNDLSSMREAPS